MEEQKKSNMKDLLLKISVSVNVILIALVLFFAFAKKSKPERPRRPRYPITVDIDLKHFTEGGYFLGNYDAKVSIVLFNSFSCGFCKRAKNAIMPLVKKYPKDVKLVYKHFNRGTRDLQTAIAVECAGDQNKFWEMYSTIFEMGAHGNLVGYAKAIGLNTRVFKKCLTSFKHREKTEKDTQDGSRIGVRGTPSFLINKKLYVGYKPPHAMEALIQKELKK